MCVNPSTLRSGVVVGCRRCWQCIDNRVNDWVGRNLAEQQTSDVSYAVRLSYGRSHDGQADHLHSVMLFTSDMQRMLKRMRSKRFGYKVRYMIAGEYGGRFGRAHWHGIFHFSGPNLPDWKRDWANWSDEQWQRVGGVHIPEWEYSDGTPIGHVHIKQAVYAHTRYALKYMMKDQTDPNSDIKLIMSKNPPLGTEYLTRYAEQIAEAGLAPRDLFYGFQVVDAQGETKEKRFMMRGKVAELFILAYIRRWRELFGERPMPDHGPEVDVVHAYLRFGRVGRSEYLTPLDVEDREADAKFERMEAEAVRPRTIQEYFAERDFHVNSKPKFGLAEWEQMYFGQEQQEQQRQERQVGENDHLVADYLCERYAISERQLWGKSYDELNALWREARDDFDAACERFRKTGHFGRGRG